jgi:hypothetical protein
MFGQGVPRIAILGAGGMGKTILARAVLHHPDMTSRYEQCRLFVPCDTVATSIQLVALIGEYIGLKPGNDLTRRVLGFFSSSPPTLLLLDNLETIWEPAKSRGEVEKFLCLLEEVKHLALIVSIIREMSGVYANPIPDNNARSRETFQSAVDSAFPGTIEVLGPGCCTSNIH